MRTSRKNSSFFHAGVWMRSWPEFRLRCRALPPASGAARRRDFQSRERLLHQRGGGTRGGQLARSRLLFYSFANAHGDGRLVLAGSDEARLRCLLGKQITDGAAGQLRAIAILAQVELHQMT